MERMARSIVGIVAGILIASVLIGALLPVAIGFVGGPTSQTVVQDTGETISLTSDLNATLTDTSAGTNATVQLTDGAYSATKTIAVGANATFTAPDGDVTVTVETANTGNATVSYQYPTTYGWGTAEATLFGLLPLLFVLVPFIAVVTWVYKVM